MQRLLSRALIGTGVAALLAGAAVRFGIALGNQGIYWPDEIYQSLEPAHRLVFGYGLLPWEYVQGARDWLFPALVAAVVKPLAAMSAGPVFYVDAVRLLMAAVAVAALGAAYRLARNLGASAASAWVATGAAALWAPLVYFAPRALTETVSTLPVVAGFALALPESASRRRLLIGAALLGLAVVLRIQCAVFAAALLATILARRRWRAGTEVAAVFAASVLVLAALDRVTYGSWLQSPLVYLRFSLSGGPDQWGTASLGYYARVLAQEPGALGVPLAALVLLGARRSPPLVMTIAAFVVLHSLVPHKELRFILPALTLCAPAAALGLDEIVAPAWPLRPAAAALLLGCAVVSAVSLPGLEFQDLGAYQSSMPRASAWTLSEGVNRLLLVAHARSDLCGLRVDGPSLPWTGGYTYLHRPVPLYAIDRPAPGVGFYNYAITRAAAAGGAVVAASGGWNLVRFDRSCTPDSLPARLP